VYVNMADVAEEVVAACCTLVLAAGLGAANVLNKRKNESSQHGLNHTSEIENRYIIARKKWRN